ncbi:MAG: hypothetical protein KF705_16590, partial [Phycisphaeraceae bacterium]|nr:hypothetical protein [Phycisphaeraceae bacterium]
SHQSPTTSPLRWNSKAPVPPWLNPMKQKVSPQATKEKPGSAARDGEGEAGAVEDANRTNPQDRSRRLNPRTILLEAIPRSLLNKPTVPNTRLQRMAKSRMHVRMNLEKIGSPGRKEPLGSVVADAGVVDGVGTRTARSTDQRRNLTTQ